MDNTLTVLGKKIGTSSGWDGLDTSEFIFYGVELNDTGRKFIPHFEDGHDLAINFESGEVIQYDPQASDDGNGNPVKLTPDWSAFNG